MSNSTEDWVPLEIEFPTSYGYTLASTSCTKPFCLLAASFQPRSTFKMGGLLRLILNTVRPSNYFRKPEFTYGLLENHIVKPTNDRNKFVGLPIEILCLIAKLLDREYQALLRLSCKRLYVILTEYTLSAVWDTNMRQKIVRFLEKDYPPEYLACRRCGRMFRWRTRDGDRLSCPCEANMQHFKKKPDEFSTLVLLEMYSLDAPYRKISKELIDLIFRAHEKGEQYGRSIRHLNWSVVLRPAVPRSTKTTTLARVVAGKFLFSVHREVSFRDEINNGEIHDVHRLYCQHGFWNEPYHFWQPMQRLLSETMESKMSTRIDKCHWCATNYKITIRRYPQDRVRSELHSIMKFGTRYEESLACRQLTEDSRLLLSADEVSKRDLHALWDSADVSATDTTIEYRAVGGFEASLIRDSKPIETSVKQTNMAKKLFGSARDAVFLRQQRTHQV